MKYVHTVETNKMCTDTLFEMIKTIVSEYDQEMPQPQAREKPMATLFMLIHTELSILYLKGLPPKLSLNICIFIPAVFFS